MHLFYSSIYMSPLLFSVCQDEHASCKQWKQAGFCLPSSDGYEKTVRVCRATCLKCIPNEHKIGMYTLLLFILLYRIFFIFIFYSFISISFHLMVAFFLFTNTDIFSLSFVRYSGLSKTRTSRGITNCSSHRDFRLI